MISVTLNSNLVSSLSLPMVSVSSFPGSLQSSPQIDHFSSLPNELLDTIFQYLYDEPTPSLPLSKRLRPWFEKHFYRKLSFSSFDSFAEFAAVLFKTPHIAQYVYVLKVEEEEAPDEEEDDSSAEDSSRQDDFEERSRRKRHNKVRELHALLPSLLPLLTHLVKLDVPYTPPIARRLDSHLSPPPVLPHLRYLATSFELDEDEDVDLDELAQYTALPALKRLKIYDWDKYGFQNYHRSESTVLPNVTTLDIRGSVASEGSVQALTDLCPALLHLQLHDPYASSLRLCLPYLPTTLHSLSIFAGKDLELDSDLSQFTQLRYFHIASSFYAEDLLSTLSGLRSLVHLHLGEGFNVFNDLESLILRIPTLEMITLDIDEGVRGEHILGPFSPEFDVETEWARCSIVNMEDDWKLPGEDDEELIDADGLRSLLETAGRIGVTVNGSAHAALQTVEDYHLEANNRAVVYVAHGSDPWYLKECRENAARDGIDLPDYDLEQFEELGPWQVEVLEEALPERDWYMLSLAKKENCSEEEDEDDEEW
ncbi:hypothetical protein JCM5353_006954 [Sporobolomyces roseus]